MGYTKMTFLLTSNWLETIGKKTQFTMEEIDV